MEGAALCFSELHSYDVFGVDKQLSMHFWLFLEPNRRNSVAIDIEAENAIFNHILT